MIELQRKRSALRVTVVAMLVITATNAACSKVEREDPVAETAAVAPTSEPKHNYGMVGPPGGDRRKETIEYFRDFVRFDDDQETKDSSYSAEYVCDAKDCDTPGKLEIRVVPERNAHNVNWRWALANADRRGYVVAKLTNMSKRTFKPLDLKPDSTIYQWVGPVDVKGRHRITWVKINPATGEAGPFRLPRMQVRTCALSGAEKRTRSKVGLANHPTSNCPVGPALVDDTENSEASADSAALVRILYPPGMWSSCEGGCCSTEY